MAFHSCATVIAPPSVFYHIQGTIDTAELLQLDWILEEGNEVLTVDDLKNNRTKDATLLDLRNGPKFPIKAHRYYWFQLQLRNSATISDTVNAASRVEGADQILRRQYFNQRKCGPKTGTPRLHQPPISEWYK